MANRTILVTGAGGMVGSYVSAAFPDDRLVLTDIRNAPQVLDICDAQAVNDAVEQYRPDVVLHLAAATDVDYCQQDPDFAYRANTLGTENIARACEAVNAVLVYLSTMCVFWGDKTKPYTEADPPRPKTVYGCTKWYGEQAVTTIMKRYFICRAGWMIGGGPRDAKFVGKMVQLMRDGRTQLKAVNDKFGSLTYARDLLANIAVLLDTEHYGLYHILNGGVVDRYQVALSIRDILGMSNVTIEPVGSGEFPAPAPRARYEAGRNTRLEQLGLNRMPDWRSALETYLRDELSESLS
ncbi:MAG: dTDP-4-dehydrorhamnose reductase [Sedimentisphaerales bacterium]|nr:dTDP-4-dehydrorhamnose reductase [Sedimentisphaerales bacterium]